MIVINGQDCPDLAGTTLADYVASAGYRPERIAAELNGDIIPRATYADRVLTEGDRLEIVHFMGGG